MLDRRTNKIPLRGEGDERSLSPGTGAINQTISFWAERTPSAWAIAAPGLMPLTYAGLEAQLAHVHQVLHGHDLDSSDTVALLLPNGPDAAVTALAVASAARCAPLNPALRARELASYFDNLKVKALIVDPNADSPALDIAR